jgi:ABC-type glycerol-3-phosphate transport system substrate-binding protein
MSEKNSRVSRRQFLRVTALGVTATALAACAAPPAPAAPAAPAAEQPAAAEATPAEASSAATAGEMKGELIFWGHADHPIYDAGQAFMKLNPGVTFTQVEITDERTTKVEAALAAGSGAPDLNWLEANEVQAYGRRGVLLDVDELVKQYEEDLVAAKSAEARVNGRYFGMPGDITPNTLWVRPDILEKAGVAAFDKNIKYDDFLTAAKSVKEQADSSLYVFGADGGGQSTLMFQAPFYALGGNVSDESGEEILFDQGDAAVRAVEYAKMAWDAKAGLDAAWFSPPYWGAIKEGKLGGTYSPPWMRGFFETEVKTPETGQGKWASVIIPVYEGGDKHRTNVWGGATLVSYTQTQVPDVVKKFMEYTFATMDGAQVTADWGIVPPYLPWLTTKLKDVNQTLFADQTWTDTLNEALGLMRTDFYRAPAYGVAGIAGGPLYDKYFLPMMKGELDIKQGVKQWADDIRSENKKLLDSLK